MYVLQLNFFLRDYLIVVGLSLPSRRQEVSAYRLLPMKGESDSEVLPSLFKTLKLLLENCSLHQEADIHWVVYQDALLVYYDELLDL